jgi:hypothetical protein
MVSLIGVLVLWKYAGWIVGVGLLCALVNAYVRDIRPALAKRRKRIRKQREDVQARADRENAEWLAYGVYEGQYVAPTMPLTNGFACYDDIAARAMKIGAEPLRVTDHGNYQWVTGILPGYTFDGEPYGKPDWSGIIRPQ